MALKLLLINASDFWLKINNTDLDQIIPPIGLMSLSAYLKQKFGSRVETRITDYVVDIRSCDNLVSLIRSFEPDVIGVRGLTIFKDRFDMIAETAKQHSSALVIGGGAYVSSDAHCGLSNHGIDLSVIGEGEETLAEIVQRLLDHESLDGIKGTACIIDSRVVVNPARAYIDDLNTLPLPDYESIDLGLYSHYLSYGYNKRLQGVICSSRGCVFNCSFCHNLFGKKYRARNAMSVVEEIEYLFGRGVRDFYFIDDNFNYDRARAIAIFERIISKNLSKHIRIYFVNGLKGDLADESLIDAMSDAGTIWVGYAIETLSKKLLRAIHKPLDIEKVERAIRYSFKKKLLVNYWGMLGLPGEQIEDAEDLLRFMMDLPPSVIPMLFQLKVYPGTGLSKEAEGDGKPMDTSYHNFMQLVRKRPEYIDLLGKWEDYVLSEKRLSTVTRMLVEKGYTNDDITSSYNLLYRRLPEERVRQIIGGCIE